MAGHDGKVFGRTFGMQSLRKKMALYLRGPVVRGAGAGGAAVALAVALSLDYTHMLNFEAI